MANNKNPRKLSTFKLNTLLEITKLINSNVSSETLLKYFSNVLREYLNIEKILIFYNSSSSGWQIILNKGVDKTICDTLNFEKQIKPIKEITHITYFLHKNKALAYFDFIIPIYHKNTPIAFLLIGDVDEEMSGISPSIKHIQFVQTLANIIIVAIENKYLFKEKIEKEKYKKDLEIAKQVQSYLIPNQKKLARLKEIIHFEAYYHPHYEIGGDYYDVLPINNKECIFCIGDVSGKGVPAAILMANFQANFRSMIKYSKTYSLKKIVKELNAIVTEQTKNNMFITFFVAKYNKSTSTLTYINAGHTPPIFYNSKTQKITELRQGCSGLGMISNITIKTGRITKIPKDSKIFLYTDGLVETVNNGEYSFNIDKIKKVIKNGDIHQNIFYFRYIIENEADTYFDDISILEGEFV